MGMLTSVVSVVLILIIIVSAACLSHLATRPPQARFRWPALWRLACLIGALRIGAVWVGNAASHDPGWLQGLGYLFILTGLPEIYLVRGARTETVKWLVSASTVLAASSLAWAGLLVWISNRVGPHTETR
jgi:hypothetical protein